MFIADGTREFFFVNGRLRKGLKSNRGSCLIEELLTVERPVSND
jgi:hypothetical protein